MRRFSWIRMRQRDPELKNVVEQLASVVGWGRPPSRRTLPRHFYIFDLDPKLEQIPDTVAIRH